MDKVEELEKKVAQLEDTVKFLTEQLLKERLQRRRLEWKLLDEEQFDHFE